jgi:hypothetical protein
MSKNTGASAEKVVAVALLTQEELNNVRTGLKRLYPVPEDGGFDDLLGALERAARRR